MSSLQRLKGVPLNKKERVKVIPSGGYLVPEIKVISNDNTPSSSSTPLIVSGSEAILQWVDQNFESAQFYQPDPKLCFDLSVRASDGKLAGFVWYYNWVDTDGFGRSICPAVRGAMPAWLRPLVPNCFLEWTLAGERQKFRQQAEQTIGVSEDDDNDGTFQNATRMREILIQELHFFQSHLRSDDQPYLVAGASQPTAADFSVYAQLERLVGGKGPYDVYLEPAAPWLREEASLQSLWDWHQRMRSTCPVQFKGKKPPKELL